MWALSFNEQKEFVQLVKATAPSDSAAIPIANFVLFFINLTLPVFVKTH